MKIKIYTLLACLMVAAASTRAHAWDLKDLLGGDGGSNIGSQIGNAISSLVANDNFNIDDLKGTWKYSSPAVTFESDNALQKVGGAAAATALETKIEPYYSKVGLTNLVITVDEEHNFTMKAKMATMTGTITQDEKGELTFNFKALKKISLGKMTAKASKAGETLILTFDATKLIALMEKVASISGSASIKTLSKMLSSYDGLYLGFRLKHQADKK